MSKCTSKINASVIIYKKTLDIYNNTEFTEEFLLEPLCWGEEDPKNIQLVRIARNPNAHIDIQTMDEYKEYYNVLFYVMTDYYDDDDD